MRKLENHTKNMKSMNMIKSVKYHKLYENNQTFSCFKNC